jgi:hypothetical protein
MVWAELFQHRALCAGAEAGAGKVRKTLLFLKKKKQKNFGFRPRPAGRVTLRSKLQETKVFWFFFSKKNILPLRLLYQAERIVLAWKGARYA